MNNTLMTVIGFLFIFAMTTLGAFLVVFFKGTISKRVNSIFLSFASGIMIASSIWSLIMPSIEANESWGAWAFVPAVVGIIVGSIFLIVLEKVLPTDNGVSAESLRSTKLFVAVTVHNIPEGLAVGFAFGTASTIGTPEAYIIAMGLAFGIGVQNFPEGLAVALPIKGVSGSRGKGFLYGMLSGVVEPIAAIMGYFLAAYLVCMQPWLLSFAAGAMIFVVFSDMMPEAYRKSNTLTASMSFLVGFLIMMILDVALG